jgi:60 kDa SS-A/Ro ribonucleoprotein
MTQSYTEHFNNKKTSQAKPVYGKAQVKNSAGGFVFELNKWGRLHRFLILGSEGGTYYVAEKELTVANAKNVVECIKEDGPAAIEMILDISEGGKAPKNDPAIFALALCATFGDPRTKSLSYAAINRICRIGTHLFQFCDAIQKLRGWSAGLRRGVSKFYLEREADQIAYQLIKYQNREGWSHKDVLRLAHPKTKDVQINGLFRYVVGKLQAKETLVQKIWAFEDIKNTKDIKTAVKLILEHDLPREVIPTEMLNDVRIWEALLEKMPMTALIRNLAKMTQVGLLKSGLDDATKKVCDKLVDEKILKKARIHPLNVLLAMKTYAQGRGMKGSLTWNAVSRIVDTLESAFYLSFTHVEPTGKNYLLGLDVSGSTESDMGGFPISVKEAEGVLAMVTARTEANHDFIAFDNTIRKLGISASDRLDSVMKKLKQWDGGRTDCAVPMIWALKNKIPVDVFGVYTDNETWCGSIHPFQALKEYRQKMGRPAKLIVHGMTATNFTIADPNDAGMLDVVGFSSDVPEVQRSFALQDL